MPAPLAVDKEAVRVLVVAVGVREAARQMDLSENTVLAWANRGGWLQSAEAARAIKAANQLARSPEPQRSLQSPAINAADALANSLADDSKASRLSLSRGLRRVAAHVEQMPPDEALAEAQNIKATVGSLSAVHAWEAKAAQTNVMISVQMLGMRPDELVVEQKCIDVEQA